MKEGSYKYTYIESTVYDQSTTTKELLDDPDLKI